VDARAVAGPAADEWIVAEMEPKSKKAANKLVWSWF